MNAPLKHGILFSALVHVCVLVLVYFGAPMISREAAEMMKPIPVEIVPITEVTTVLAPKIEEPPEENPEEDQPEKPVPPESKPEERIEPTSVDEAPPQPEEAVEQKAELIPAPPKVKPVVKPTPAPKNKPVPPKMKLVKDSKKPNKEQKKPDAFASLLKNLQQNVGKPVSARKDGAATNPIGGQISDVLSVSEMDALRQQISQCWNLQVGARDITSLVINVRLSVSSDRKVLKAQIVGSGNGTAGYRAAAESALRAVRDPRCSPLKLPPNKYEKWKEFTLRFSPKDFAGL